MSHITKTGINPIDSSHQAISSISSISSADPADEIIIDGQSAAAPPDAPSTIDQSNPQAIQEIDAPPIGA
jgi:hypothetical protein